ncbi:MAG: recombinase family protein [Candidatus Paceibacterota bacterium]
MKAIIVARVSTDEQKENSPSAQLFRMQHYCENRDFIISKEFSFIESAYKIKRDEFDNIIEFIEDCIKRKEKIAVCFDKVDRLSRNIFDKRVAWLYEKAINNEIELHFVSDSQVINDKMNAGDKFAFGMKLGLSKYYSDAISDNVKRAFEQKRRNGEWTGAVRLGYLNVPADIEKRLRKDIIIDPERGYLITKMFEMYATGNYSLETIRKEITDLGLRSLKEFKLSKSCVENILKDPFYCGIATSKKYEQTWVHKYPRLITQELFERCKEIREGKNKKRSKFVSKEFIFKGLLTCKNCGCMLSPEIHKKKSGLTYVYYSCTNSKGICKRQYVPETALLKPIYKVLDQFEGITEEAQNTIVKELRETTEAEVTFHKAQVNRIRAEYDQLKKKDDRLLEMYLEEDKSITKDIYDKKHQEYHDKIQLLEIELSEHTNADYDYQTTVATVLSVARRVKEIFESSEPYEKRAILNYLLQNPVVNEKKLEFTIRSPFNLVLELATSPNWLRG